MHGFGDRHQPHQHIRANNPHNTKQSAHKQRKKNRGAKNLAKPFFVFCAALRRNKDIGTNRKAR